MNWNRDYQANGTEVLELIGQENIKSFTKAVWEQKSPHSGPTEQATKTAYVVYDLLTDKGLVQQHGNQTFVDVLVSAALIYDIYESESWTSVFKAREELPAIANEYMPEAIQSGLYEAIEAQAGTSMPVTKVRAMPGTPQELFATAVWIVKTYLV